MVQSEEVTSSPPPRAYEHGFVAMKKCKHGSFLYSVHDVTVGRSLDLYGQWCEGELGILGQVIRPGDVVVDVGAHIGTHTIFFARQVTDQGRVIAFEPQRMIYQNLCANVALNGLVNVFTRQQGVGSRNETIPLTVFDPRQKGNFAAMRLTGHTSGELVEVIRIDDLRLDRCNLIKIDVEGMECDVLAGARETIARLRPVLFVENDTLDRSAATIQWIDSLDYDAYWYLTNYFQPDNFFGNQQNIFDQVQPSANLICFHRASQVSIERLPKVTGPQDNWQLALARQGK